MKNIVAAILILVGAQAGAAVNLLLHDTNGVIAEPSGFFQANIEGLTNALNAAGYSPGGGGGGGGATNITDLADISLGTPSDLDILSFDFTSGKWTNRAATAVGWALIQAATAADQRTALGLGTAAQSNTGDFEPAGVASTDITDSTAPGRALLTAATAADQRTALALGTAAQAATVDFEPAGVDSSEITDSTAVGRQLMTATDAAAGRGVLNLGTAATSPASAFLADGASNGIVARTGAGTVTTFHIVGDSEAEVTGGDGQSGNVIIAIGASIARVAALASYQPLALILTQLSALSPATGAVLWYNGTVWTNLPVGSVGNILTVQSGPVLGWASPAGGGDAYLANDQTWTGNNTWLGTNWIHHLVATNFTADNGNFTTVALGSPLGTGSGGTSATTASGARANLGLVIGSDVQAFSAYLQQIATVSWASGGMPYYDGSNLTNTASTTYGRAVLAGASYQAIRDLVNEGANPPAYAYGLTVHSAVTNWVADMRFPVLKMSATADVHLIHATNKPAISTNVYGTVLQITGDTQDRTLTWNSTWNAIGGVTSATIRSNEVTIVSIMAPGPNETDVIVGVPSSGAASTAGTATVGRFFAPQAHYPSSGAAYFGYRASVPVGVFVDGSETHFRFMGVFPEGFTSSAVTVVVRWASDATSGNGIWGAKIWNLSDSDVDSETFDTAVEHTDATSGTAGTAVTSTLASVGIDSATAGDAFILDVYRAGDDASDTLSNVAHAISVEVLAE